MKKAIFLFTCCAILSASLFSCKKHHSTSVGPYASMNDVFNMLRLKPLSVTIDAGRDTSFYGNSGTRYIFYGNSFMTAAGATVAGNIQVQVCEYLQKGDMVFSKMLPISNNEPLLSGGEINVSASQGGQALYLKPLYRFQANVPQPGAPVDMDYFSGQPVADTTQTVVNWIKPLQDSTAPGRVFKGLDDTLDIISDSLRECNADYFMTPYPDYQTFTVTVGVTGATLSGTNKLYGYTIYDTYKGVWPLGMIGNYSNGVYTEEHVPTIPVHFVVFTIINGDFYGGMVGATPVSGNNYTVTLTKTDPTVFRNLVNAL